MKHTQVFLFAKFACLIPFLACQAQSLTVLHTFKGGKDGAYPLPGSAAAFVSDANGDLYGETAGTDVATDFGTIFELVPPQAGQTKWAELVLYRFKGGADGDYPGSALLEDGNGGFYGTTFEGGVGSCSPLGTAAGCGTVFDLSPPLAGKTAWREQVLYRFQAGADGGTPAGNVISNSNGALYGMTSAGGGGACDVIGPGCGTVFRLDLPAPGKRIWTETVLYAFQGGSDGDFPEAGLTLDASGDLYGTTSYGGTSGCGGVGCGTVFQLSPPQAGQTAWTETVLYRFQGGADGGLPQPAPVFNSAGDLLGTTLIGGSGYGTVYKLVPPKLGHTKWAETVLYAFQGGTDGADPNAGLSADGGGSYVTTTYYGGTGSCAFANGPTGCGTVVKLTPPAKGSKVWTETVLHSLNGTNEGTIAGAGIFVGSGGVLYSASGVGGNPLYCTGTSAVAPGCGTAFSVSPLTGAR